MANSAIQLLLKACRSDHPEQQIQAIQELQELNYYDATEILIPLLQSRDTVVRSTVAEALGYLGAKKPELTGAALINLLADPDDIVRSDAIDALGQLAYVPASTPISRLLLVDTSPTVRASAAEALGDIGTQKAIPSLLRALNDLDGSVRAYAANALGLLGDQSVLSHLQKSIHREPSIVVKAEYYGALSRLGSKESLNTLLDLLANANQDQAINMLQIIDDLSSRKVPSGIYSIIDQMEASLKKIVQQFPILQGDVNTILKQLSNLNKKS